MKLSFEKVKEWYSSLYSSQDSKYFIATATKLTIVPTVSFGIVFYSLWTIMEMNFNFFVANGFASGDLFKEAFYDQIFGDIAHYFPYFLAIIAVVFLIGLFVSWLVLRSFDNIEKYTFECFDNPSEDFEVQGGEKNKLINQVSRIFFKYIQICRKENKRPRFRLPKKLQNLNSPPTDKVFFLQYGMVVIALCMLTSWALHTFTIDLHEQIINGGIEVLPADRSITAFLGSQKDILFNIYFIAIMTNIMLYLLISKNIIKTVEGVSFGFSRDMLRIINGEHHARLRPRFADPGKGLANAINDYLDEYFPEDEIFDENESVSEAIDMSYDNLVETSQNQDFEDELINDDQHMVTAVNAEYEDYDDEEFEDEDTNILPMDHTHTQMTEMQEMRRQPVPRQRSEQVSAPVQRAQQQQQAEAPPEDLPPAFIEEKQVANGEKVFHITTPDGLKVENVDAEMLLKIVKESKK